MPKSKQRKNHKSKVSARNLKIKEQKQKIEKMKRNFIMDLIKKEQESGLFDNNQSIDQPKSDLNIQGPII